MAEAKTKTTKLYRVENPNITAHPDGVTSHEDLIGQWFSPDLDYALTYLPKSTQTYGKGAKVVDGARLVVAEVPTENLAAHDAQSHPVARQMDIEPGNYIIPRDGTYGSAVVPLDPVVGDLRGKLNNFYKFIESKDRVRAHIGSMAVK